MAVLTEEDEEEAQNDISSVNGDSSRKRELTGVVRDRVLSLEHNSIVSSPSHSHSESRQGDLRMRTFSGIEEIQNEEISPITTSRQNTIREHALRRWTEMPIHALHSKLEDIAERPTSRSSDAGIQYGHNDSKVEDFGEITSLSLPDDLSMGTQDFVSRGGFVNSRRGGRSIEDSFQRKTLSSSIPCSLEQSIVDPQSMAFRSSPPPYNTTTRHSHVPPTAAIASPNTPQRAQKSDSADRPRSSGSPLKLFGNYDTFTNNKLLRRMGQFEDNEDKDPSQKEETPTAFDYQDNMRISHFGKGQLDKFTFDERVQTQAVPSSSRPSDDARIFEKSMTSEENAQTFNVAKRSNLDEKADPHQGTESKREPSSSIKDRTPKRRRTLLQNEIEFTQDPGVSDATKSMGDANQLAGKKRKDARYDGAELAADPATLASRQMLRPKPARRRNSGILVDHQADEDQPLDTNEPEDEIAELAGELASFGIGITQIANDSRKPSVTTQDFLNEATKIMQIIRQRGKPKSGLSSVEERLDEAEINPDSILDLDVEGEDTTVDNFSRPPSRNGSIKKRRERMGSPDASMMSHLQKYQDGDDLDLLITSKLGSLHLPPQPHAEEAALVPLPDDNSKQEEESLSSPANIRIRESREHQQKRKHSTSTLEGPPSLPTHASSGTSTGTTIPTCSSSSSGNKGRIPPGMVLVPEQVGIMTYDHSTKSWIRGKAPQVVSPSSRKPNSEEDPFGDIPDLSIDEQKEAERMALSSTEAEPPKDSVVCPARQPAFSSRPHTREGAQLLPSDTATGGSKFSRLDSSMPVADTRATSWATADSQSKSRPLTNQTQKNEISADHDEEVEHEIRIHDGRLSEAPPSPNRLSKKARAVTIAFSSPLVSAIAYHNEYTTSEMEHSVASDRFEEDGKNSSGIHQQSTPSRMQSFINGQSGPPAGSRMFLGRPVSRIDEQDEDDLGQDLSVVHVAQSNSMTPAENCRMPARVNHNKPTSMICLTPLSEFSLHQTDHPRHLEASYVAERAHPTSLQQAHGSLALAVDELMKAITDAEPYELYWEHIRRLDLGDKKLTTLHRLEEFCSAIEVLHISGNEVTQLSGVPVSVRTLLAQHNCLSSLTSWGHMQNLQYLDISGNGLESLDGLSCLAHLRELKANRNRIRNLEGVFDLNALLHLELQENELATVDFESAELTRLRHLDLSGNQLTAVRSTSALPALQTLHLGRNKLVGFGASDENHTALRDLRLSLNRMEAINLERFPSIEVLYLDNNRLHSIQGLSTARHLNTLSVREQSDSPNLLGTIFSTSSECRKLYLSSNPAPLEGLQMPTLPHLNLKYLELASCGLTSLAATFGDKIPNCRTLNLNFNAVKDLQPLRGCGRLNKLLIAGNRLNKLRRTCIALTRLPALTKVDLRDNPLTVGFYPPFRESRIVVHGEATTDAQDPYAVSIVDQTLDSKWVRHLDEGTRMKRRTIELFLAKGCEKLLELDGLAFDRVALLQQDEIWQKLTRVGVIAKESRAISTAHAIDKDQALPLDAEGQGAAKDRERSLFVE
jgi:protein NUD1